MRAAYRSLTTAAVVAAVTVLSAIGPPAAYASGTRCAASTGKGENCMTVLSKGTHVDEVRIGRFTRDPKGDENVCIGKVKWYVTSKGQVYEGVGEYPVYECGVGGKYFTLNIDRSFSNESEICGIVYQLEEEEKIYPGQPCYTLKNG